MRAVLALLAAMVPPGALATERLFKASVREAKDKALSGAEGQFAVACDQGGSDSCIAVMNRFVGGPSEVVVSHDPQGNVWTPLDVPELNILVVPCKRVEVAWMDEVIAIACASLDYMSVMFSVDRGETWKEKELVVRGASGDRVGFTVEHWELAARPSQATGDRVMLFATLSRGSELLYSGISESTSLGGSDLGMTVYQSYTNSAPCAGALVVGSQHQDNIRAHAVLVNKDLSVTTVDLTTIGAIQSTGRKAKLPFVTKTGDQSDSPYIISMHVCETAQSVWLLSALRGQSTALGNTYEFIAAFSDDRGATWQDVTPVRGVKYGRVACGAEVGNAFLVTDGPNDNPDFSTVGYARAWVWDVVSRRWRSPDTWLSTGETAGPVALAVPSAPRRALLGVKGAVLGPPTYELFSVFGQATEFQGEIEERITAYMPYRGDMRVVTEYAAPPFESFTTPSMACFGASHCLSAWGHNMVPPNISQSSSNLRIGRVAPSGPVQHEIPIIYTEAFDGSLDEVKVSKTSDGVVAVVFFENANTAGVIRVHLRYTRDAGFSWNAVLLAEMPATAGKLNVDAAVAGDQIYAAWTQNPGEVTYVLAFATVDVRTGLVIARTSVGGPAAVSSSTPPMVDLELIANPSARASDARPLWLTWSHEDACSVWQAYPSEETEIQWTQMYARATDCGLAFVDSYENGPVVMTRTVFRGGRNQFAISYTSAKTLRDGDWAVGAFPALESAHGLAGATETLISQPSSAYDYATSTLLVHWTAIRPEFSPFLTVTRRSYASLDIRDGSWLIGQRSLRFDARSIKFDGPSGDTFGFDSSSSSHFCVLANPNQQYSLYYVGITTVCLRRSAGEVVEASEIVVDNTKPGFPWFQPDIVTQPPTPSFVEPGQGAGEGESSTTGELGLSTGATIGAAIGAAVIGVFVGLLINGAKQGASATASSATDSAVAPTAISVARDIPQATYVVEGEDL